MVEYIITTYRADLKKNFVTGSSSGGIMTNVLSAVCPDVTATASEYSCLSDPDCANSEKLFKVKKLGCHD